MQMMYDNRNKTATGLTKLGVESYGAATQQRRVIDSQALLSEIKLRGIPGTRVASVLKLPSSRVTELFQGKRRLLHDEAVKLVEAFDLESTPSISPQVARLLALHAANQIGSNPHPDDPRVQSVAQDFEAFLRFASNPAVREKMDLLEGFLQGLSSRSAVA